MKQKIFFMISILLLLTAGCRKLPSYLEKGEKEFVWEGFEKESLWSAVGDSWSDKDSSLGAGISKRFSSAGESSLELTYSFNGLNGAVFFTEDISDPDWSRFKGVVLDFFNASGEELEASLSFCTGDQWVWHETRSFILFPGKNFNLRFNIQDGRLKSEETNWSFRSALVNSHQVHRFSIKLTGREGLASSLFVDNIRIIS